MIRECLKLLCGCEGGACLKTRIDEACAALEKYASEIELFNKKYGLVSYKNRDELILRHIIDSIAPYNILHKKIEELKSENKTALINIADAGSGAGLPGIPLSIIFNEAHFTLIEAKKKRALFLHNTRALLSLQNVSIAEGLIENQREGAFDVLVFRALSPLSKELIEKLFKLIKRGGFLAAYKGRRGKITSELENCPAIDAAVFPYGVPYLEEERHIVIIPRPCNF